MAIYSQPLPQGGYRLFESLGQHSLGDDLPTPAMPPSEKVGCPSVECGRSLPASVRLLEESDTPSGLVTPIAGAPLGDETASGAGSSGLWIGVACGAGVVATLWYLSRRSS